MEKTKGENILWKHKWKLVSLVFLMLIIPNAMTIATMTIEERQNGIPSNSCTVEPVGRMCQLLNANNNVSNIGILATITIIGRVGWKLLNKADEKLKEKQSITIVKEK